MTSLRLSWRTADVLLVMLIIVLAAGVRLYDLNGAGGTFDENNYLRIAVALYGAFHDADFSKERWLYPEHPAIGKYIHTLFWAPIIADLSERDTALLLQGFYTPPSVSGEIYRLARYSSVLYEAFTIALVYLFCTMFLPLHGRKVGIVASGILILLPNFIMYSKVASLDAPTAFFFTLGAFCLAVAIRYDTWKAWVVLGIVSGLAFGTKFNLGLLFIFYIIIFLVWKYPLLIAIPWQKTQRLAKNVKETIAHFLRTILYPKLAIVPFIALAVLFISWPWLWPAPVERFSQSTGHWGGEPAKEPWFGVMTPVQSFGQRAPVHYTYYFVYFTITTPLLILVLFVAGLHYQYKNCSFWNVFVLLWFLTPFLWTFSPQKGNGMRYLIMIYPPLAILAAQGLVHALRTPRRLAIGAGMLFLYLFIITINIHPYYFDFYNSIVGGPQAVQQGNLFIFDWFGEGKKEAVEWINANAPPGATVGAKWNPEHDFGGWRQDIQAYTLIGINYSGDASYVMMNHRYKQYDEATDIVHVPLEDYELVYTVRAGGAPLGWIYQKKP